MIKQVNVTNPKKETLKLLLADPYATGLLVTNITGLGPPQSDINYTELATGDGGLWSSSRTQPRNIVISLQMVDKDAEHARHVTYEYFPIKQLVRLEFITDERSLFIDGYVESHDDNIFSKTETTQISILCLFPWFYKIGEEASVFSGVKPLFEFPFSNESLTEPMIEFGYILRDTRATLYYEGDVETGLIITVHFEDVAEDISIYNVDTQEIMKIDTDRIVEMTGKAMQPMDDIEICTIPGQKYIRLLRDGEYTNIISALDRDSTWLKLRWGTNMYGFSARVGEGNLLVTFSYRTMYGGV